MYTFRGYRVFNRSEKGIATLTPLKEPEPKVEQRKPGIRGLPPTAARNQMINAVQFAQSPRRRVDVKALFAWTLNRPNFSYKTFTFNIRIRKPGAP